MTRKLYLAPVPSEETLASSAESSHEQGEISLNQARRRSGLLVLEHTPDDQSGALPGHVNNIGHEVTAGEVGLELVTEDHVPQPGVQHETKFKKPPKPRTRRERLAADQAPVHQRVTPHGHDPYIPVRDSGRAASH